jgi:hypothetical protein
MMEFPCLHGTCLGDIVEKGSRLYQVAVNCLVTGEVVGKGQGNLCYHQGMVPNIRKHLVLIHQPEAGFSVRYFFWHGYRDARRGLRVKYFIARVVVTIKGLTIMRMKVMRFP